MNVRSFFAYLLYICTLPIFCHARFDIKNLTLDQKIGQLFMVAAVSDEEIAKDTIAKKTYRMDKEYIEQMIAEYHIGGIIYLGKSEYKKQIERTQHFQSLSTIPLLFGQDLEPGRVGASRFPDVFNFPSNQQLGNVNDLDYTYQIGRAIGGFAKMIGIDVVFAPVADVNNNPKNPVINDRSFGNNPELVAQHAIAFARGLEDMRIIACAKHFPGHGDTEVDSHYALPLIAHDQTRLHAIELLPFKELITAKIPSIMIAHLEVPALEEEQNLPSSLSKKIVTDLLRKELGFDGIIFTDGLDMGGITNHYSQGNAELNALLAGNDMLLSPVDVPAAVSAIKQALADKRITEQEIDAHVEKILSMKEQLYS